MFGSFFIILKAASCCGVRLLKSFPAYALDTALGTPRIKPPTASCAPEYNTSNINSVANSNQLKIDAI